MYETVLKRIMQNQGEVFHTITNLPFTYQIQNEALSVSRTNYIIPLSDISKAFQLLPCAGPGAIGKTVRGPSYIWAILNDPRVQDGNLPKTKRSAEAKTEEKPIEQIAQRVVNYPLEKSILEKYEKRFQQLKSTMDSNVIAAMDEALRIAQTGSDTALIPLAKTLEGSSGLLNALCADNTRCHLSWGRDQETDKLFKAVQYVSSILPSYVNSALQNFVQLRNRAAHDTTSEAEKQRKVSDGLEAYLLFVEWYYTHYKTISR